MAHEWIQTVVGFNWNFSKPNYLWTCAHCGASTRLGPHWHSTDCAPSDNIPSMKTRAETLAIVQQHLLPYAPHGRAVLESTSLFSLDVDSLEVVDLVGQFEQELDIIIPDDSPVYLVFRDEGATVDQLVNALLDRVQEEEAERLVD